MYTDPKKWQRIDQSHSLRYIDASKDKCYFLRSYNPDLTYSESEDVNLVSNLKRNKKVYPQSQPYIEKARRQFAEDLIPIINYCCQNMVTKVSINFIPVSQSALDQDYDDRFEEVARHLKQHFGDKILVENCILQQRSRLPISQVSARRDDSQKELLKSAWQWRGFRENPKLLLIIDDVITTGMNYRAFKEYVLDHHRVERSGLMGVFWAMAKRL